jgi:hypothetical protein
MIGSKSGAISIASPFKRLLPHTKLALLVYKAHNYVRINLSQARARGLIRYCVVVESGRQALRMS